MAPAIAALRRTQLAALSAKVSRGVDWALHTMIESESGASYAERSHAAYVDRWLETTQAALHHAMRAGTP